MSLLDNQRAHIVIVIIAFIIFLVIVGVCVGALERLFLPNTRLYVKDNIYASGRIVDPVPIYGYIRIGGLDEEYDGSLHFEVKFPNDVILSFPNPDINIIETVLFDSERESNDFFYDWPEGAREIHLTGARIALLDEKLLQLCVYSSDISIKTETSQNWCALPLTDQDLVMLFGEPDSISEYWSQ